MPFLIIGIIILIYGFSNFKKAFLWYIVFKLYLVQNISLIDMPGIPLLTLELFMNIMFVLLFFGKKKHLQTEIQDFPYKSVFILIAICYFFSSVFAYIGFVGAISQYVKQMFSDILFVWMMWMLINTGKDVKFIFKWFTISFVMIGFYGIYENFIQQNPLVEYEMSLMGDSDRIIDFLYDADGQRGYRVQSVFEHAIGAGMNCSLYIIFALSMFLHFNFKISKSIKVGAVVAILLSFACLVFSNSRGPIVFFLLGLLGIVDFRNRKFYVGAVAIVLVGVIILPYFSDYMDNFLSLFDSKAQEKVGGSDANMRFEQLGAAIELMKMSPLFGLGYKFTNVMDNNLVAALLGMESIWFRIITQFGLAGVIANICYAYTSIFKVPLRYKSKGIFFIALAYWVTASMTSTPGFLMYFYFLLIIIFIKASYIYENDRANLSV